MVPVLKELKISYWEETANNSKYSSNTNWMLPGARHSAISFNPLDNLMCRIPRLSVGYRWENWSLQKLNNLPDQVWLESTCF